MIYNIIIYFIIISLVFPTFLISSESNIKLKINETENEKKLSFEYDLGLGENLLEGLQQNIYESIDNAIDPTIDTIKEIQKNNIQKLNTENYFNEDPITIKEDWMKFIGINDISNATNGIKEKYKGGIGDSIFNSGKWHQSTDSGLNPLKKFNENIEEKTSEIKKDINKWSILSKSQKDTMNKLENELSVYEKLDLGTIINESFNKKEGKYFNNYIVDLISGKNPNEAFDNFYQNQFPEYYPGNSSVSFSFGEAIMPTNNMCDITKCILGDSSCSIEENNMAKKIKEKAEELRKILMQRAIYVLVQKLIKEFYINEYIQYSQRAMSCSVEATISTATSGLGNAISSTGFSAPAFGNSNSSGISSTNAQGIKNSAETTADCLRIDDLNTKTEDNKDMKIGLNELGASTQFWLLPPLEISEYIPFAALGGSGTYQTDMITKIKADKDNAKRCIEKGRTNNWKDAYNTCMSSGEISKFKINSELKATIADLFSSIRKHKKLQCEFTKELSSTEKMNFSLLKYSDLIPTLISTEYNTDDNNKQFMDGMAKILNDDILIIKKLTNNQSGIQSVFNSLKINNKENVFTSNVNGKFFTFDSDTGLSNFSTNLNKFCNYNGEIILNEKNIKEKMKSDTNFNEKISYVISDMNFCSEMYKDIILKPIIKEDIYSIRNNLMLEMLLEHKFLYEESDSIQEKTSLKNKFNQYTETISFLNTLTDTEKDIICKGVNIGDSVHDISNYDTSNKIIKQYENSYIENGIKKYCVQFNITKTNELIHTMESSYDFPILEGSVARNIIKETTKELLELENEGY